MNRLNQEYEGSGQGKFRLESWHVGSEYIFILKNGQQECGVVMAETPNVYFVRFGPDLSGSIYKDELVSMKRPKPLWK